MIFRATQDLTNTLSTLPESGMGYQVIQATRLGGYWAQQFVVYNGQMLIELGDSFDRMRNQVVQEGFSAALRQSSEIRLVQSSISLLPKTARRSMMVENRFAAVGKGRHSGGVAAKNARPEYANGFEMFVRLSAFENDIRIDFQNMRLKPQSYSTTEEDYRVCVKTADDPVDRYALPNNETIKWAFYIRPFKVDILQRGIVQPDFGKRGGGIEALFEKGTSNGTYLEKRPYGNFR
jgi:hypothetical protein